VQPTDSTVSKLRRLRQQLEDEFGHLPSEFVEGEFHDVAADLLEHAHFDDFVPLLTDRRVRERLAEQPA